MICFPRRRGAEEPRAWEKPRRSPSPERYKRGDKTTLAPRPGPVLATFVQGSVPGHGETPTPVIPGFGSRGFTNGGGPVYQPPQPPSTRSVGTADLGEWVAPSRPYNNHTEKPMSPAPRLLLLLLFSRPSRGRRRGVPPLTPWWWALVYHVVLCFLLFCPPVRTWAEHRPSRSRFLPVPPTVWYGNAFSDASLRLSAWSVGGPCHPLPSNPAPGFTGMFLLTRCPSSPYASLGGGTDAPSRPAVEVVPLLVLPPSRRTHGWRYEMA